MIRATLGEGCVVYERGDKMGRKNSSIQYSFDKKRGTPVRIGNQWDTDFWEFRERLPKYFNMYHSYSEESEEMMLKRGEDHRVLPFWKKKSFKLFCIIAAIMLAMGVITIFLFKSTTSTIDTLTNRKAQELKKG